MLYDRNLYVTPTLVANGILLLGIFCKFFQNEDDDVLLIAQMPTPSISGCTLNKIYISCKNTLSDSLHKSTTVVSITIYSGNTQVRSHDIQYNFKLRVNIKIK